MKIVIVITIWEVSKWIVKKVFDKIVNDL